MSWEIWVAGGILVVAFFIFIILSRRKEYHQPTIRETSGVGYTEERDRVSLEDAGAEEDEESEEDEDEEEDGYNAEVNTTQSSQSSMASSLSSSMSTIFFIGIMVIGGVIFFNVSGILRQAGDYTSGGGDYTSADYNTIVADSLGGAGAIVVEWLNLIVLLVVIGIIVSVFVRMSNLFDTSPAPKRKVVIERPKAVRHYEGMRNKMTRASAKRDKEKAKRLRREGEQ